MCGERMARRRVQWRRDEQLALRVRTVRLDALVAEEHRLTEAAEARRGREHLLRVLGREEQLLVGPQPAQPPLI